MGEFARALPAVKGAGALIMAALAVLACWALAGRRPPGRSRIRLVWWGVLAGLWALGGVALISRFTGGLGSMTNLSDTFPWGLWISFDVLSGVALAAGGFLIAGSVYIFGSHKFHPILRPAVLTAYLGYLLVVGGLLVDLGRPYNIWHPIIYWQHRSVMFEVAWCVSLYSTVLTLEFLPILLEKLGWGRLLRLVKSITIPVVIAGIILSTLHQSSLGALFLIVPQKLLPLWYSPLLPAFFLLSAVTVGCAMVVVESTLSSRAFGRSLELPVVLSLSRAEAVLLLLLFFFRIADVTLRNAWVHAFRHPFQGTAFLAEMALLVGPAFALLLPRWSESPRAIFVASLSVVLGVVLNRLNVGWLGMLPSAERLYFPSWQEVIITLNLISYGVVLFGLAARYLPVFERAVLVPAPSEPEGATVTRRVAATRR